MKQSSFADNREYEPDDSDQHWRLCRSAIRFNCLPGPGGGAWNGFLSGREVGPLVLGLLAEVVTGQTTSASNANIVVKYR